MNFSYQYPRPAVTVDCAIFTKIKELWNILLIERANLPYKGFWALPGGFLDINETIEQCAFRELSEETGLRDIRLSQLHVFSAVDRDPRGRIISVLFYGMVHTEQINAKAGDDAKKIQWFPLNDLPHLAFDHIEIIKTCLTKITLD